MNIEDKLFIDVRFRKLVRILGNEDQALGMLVRFWQTAQKHWGQGHLVPMHEFVLGDFQPLVDSCFAEIRPEGVYAKGAEKEFEWYRTTCEKSKKGGEANRKRKNSLGDSPGASKTPTLEIPRDSPLTLTLTLTNKDLKSDAIASGAASAASPEGVGSDLILKKPLPPTNPSPKGDPRSGMGGGQAFLKAYVDAYTARYGCRPAITGKDAGISKRLVAALGHGRACLAAQVYLQLNDSWFETKHHDLATLEQNLNKVTHALATGKGSEHVADEKFWNEVWRDSGQVQRSDSETKTNLRGQGLPARQGETDF